jgi:hypothetical protein
MTQKRNRRRKLDGYDLEAEFDLDQDTPPAVFRGDPSAVIPPGRGWS